LFVRRSFRIAHDEHYTTMNNRMARVRSLMKRELSEILQKDFSFPGVLVTVNEVDVTPDLRNAHAFIGILGDEVQRRKVVAELNARRGMIQRKIGDRVALKYTPQLHFKCDDSVERGVRVVALIDQLDTLCPPASEGDEASDVDEGSDADESKSNE